jgi:hypothetical protein
MERKAEAFIKAVKLPTKAAIYYAMLYPCDELGCML